jgi:hypothetical protein
MPSTGPCGSPLLANLPPREHDAEEGSGAAREVSSLWQGPLTAEYRRAAGPPVRGHDSDRERHCDSGLGMHFTFSSPGQSSSRLGTK